MSTAADQLWSLHSLSSSYRLCGILGLRRPRTAMRIKLPLLFLLVLSANLLPGQTGLATITGTVSDPTGAVIAEVPIEVRNMGTGQTVSAATTTTGNFTLGQLAV